MSVVTGKPCGKCEGEGTFTSGLMVVRPPVLTPIQMLVTTVAGSRRPPHRTGKPYVLMHPDLAARVEPLVKDAPRGAPAFTLKGIDVFVDDNVPLLATCDQCGGTGSL